MPIPLDRAELLSITGSDAVAFANAQFTSDVAALAANHWQWSAWLNAQGRALAFFALLRIEPDSLLVWLPLGSATRMRDELARYVFRSRVAIKLVDDWTVSSMTGAETAHAAIGSELIARDGGYAFTIAGVPQRGVLLGPKFDSPFDASALLRWRAADALAGFPLLASDLDGEFISASLGLDRIGAISFRKGCFPGQEIAARIHHRGGNKRFPYVLRFAPTPIAELPHPGDPVRIRGIDSSNGTILYAGSGEEGVALAVLPVPSVDPNDLEVANKLRITSSFRIVE